MSGALKNSWIAPGTRPMMPAKMMKLIPLPIPRSVTSSPIHMRSSEPVVRMTICTRVSGLARSNRVVRTSWLLRSARKA